MSAGDAVRAARLLGAGSAMGLHFGTFRQGDDADGEPADSLRAALAPLGGAACEAWFWAPRNGDSRVIPAMPAMRARETGCPRPCSSAGCSR
jgi:hypothetical protein